MSLTTDVTQCLSDAVAWTEEAHDVEPDAAYVVPVNYVIGQACPDAAMPALTLQLLDEGARLAGLPNAIFDRPLRHYSDVPFFWSGSSYPWQRGLPY